MNFTKHRIFALIIVISVINCKDIKSKYFSTENTRLRTTVLGTDFIVRKEFDSILDEMILKTRENIRKHKDSGKIIAYISTPIGSKGGGDFYTNIEIAKEIKKNLEMRYGNNYFYALNPGEMKIPKVDDISAKDGEYLYLFTEILAGPDGTGNYFDMFYFVGPKDIHTFYNFTGNNDLNKLENFIIIRAKKNPEFRENIANNLKRRKDFIRYYGVKASSSFSNGAHDEWNIAILLNKKREIHNRIAIHYNGTILSPSAMESSVQSGYEQN